jgi:YVTN family beta-propeller protein
MLTPTQSRSAGHPDQVFASRTWSLFLEAAVRTVSASLLILLAAGVVAAAEPKDYRLLKAVSVAGEGGWDYLIADDAGRRVYVSHGNQVDVLDADSYEVKGTITDLKGVHGIALDTDTGRGFISNGQSDTVTIFDLKTLKSLDTVKTGKNPDAIIYDPSSKRVFAFNGRGNSATVIGAADGKVVDTIELGGRPEFAVADGAGAVFVNLEDKNTVLKIDSDKLKVLERWALDPGKEPTGLAMDPKSKRLFVGCHNKLLIILSVQDGKVVDKQPIGEGVDAVAFDPETKLIFSSCRDGTVTVVRADGDDKYSVVQTIKTKQGSKTMALDRKTHKLFLPSADFKPNPDNPRGRPTIVPKSFAVLVFGNMTDKPEGR